MIEKDPRSDRLRLCLLLLRLGVAVVMAFWTADKFLNPDHAATIFSHFYGLQGLGSQLFLVVGAAEALVVLAFATGLFRTFSYGAVLIIHTVSTISSWRQYAEPFDNLLFLAAWPMLAACITLFLLRQEDVFTVGAIMGAGVPCAHPGEGQ